MNRELAEVRRYWPRVRRLSGDYCRVSTRSGGGARVRFHWCLFGKQFVFQFERLSANRRLWRTVRTLNCGDEFEEAMRAAGFGPRPQYAMKGHHFAADRKRRVGARLIMRNWRAGTGRAPAPIERWVESLYRLPALVSTQRPRKGARLGRRKREGRDKEDARQFAQWRGR